MGHGRRGHHGHPVALSAFSIEDEHAQTLLPGNQKEGTVLGGICRVETAQTDFAKVKKYQRNFKAALYNLMKEVGYMFISFIYFTLQERMSLSFMVHPTKDQSKAAIRREHGTLMQPLKLSSHMTLPFISSLELHCSSL